MTVDYIEQKHKNIIDLWAVTSDEFNETLTLWDNKIRSCRDSTFVFIHRFESALVSYSNDYDSVSTRYDMITFENWLIYFKWCQVLMVTQSLLSVQETRNDAFAKYSFTMSDNVNFNVAVKNDDLVTNVYARKWKKKIRYECEIKKCVSSWHRTIVSVWEEVQSLESVFQSSALPPRNTSHDNIKPKIKDGIKLDEEADLGRFAQTIGDLNRFEQAFTSKRAELVCPLDVSVNTCGAYGKSCVFTHLMCMLTIVRKSQLQSTSLYITVSS